jgi:hypothetical protein
MLTLMLQAMPSSKLLLLLLPITLLRVARGSVLNNSLSCRMSISNYDIAGYVAQDDDLIKLDAPS